jgi:Protein of unknown function (DUF3011)
MKSVWIGLVLAGLWGLAAAPAAHAQYYGGAGNVVRCESVDFRDNYCPIDTRGGVRLLRQISRTACYEGETWGYDRRGVWVTNGCAADFEAAGGGYADRPGYGRPDNGYGRPQSGYGQRDRGGYGSGQSIVCESRDYRYTYCRAPVRRDVDLSVQISKSECRFNRTWGWDRGGIWVDQGCGGEFIVY